MKTSICWQSVATLGPTLILMTLTGAAQAAPQILKAPFLKAPFLKAPFLKAPFLKAPSAAKRMNTLGPENGRMAQRTGTWDVVETVWASPGAVPTSHRYVAVRKMVGPFFQEIIQPATGSAVPDFRRMYYLSFNRVEGRWKYVSLDTRNPVGLMPASSFGPGERGQITLTFEPFALPGSGTNVTGQMLRMDEIMTRKDASHDFAEERFMMADGSGKMWVAYRYDYVRRT